MARVVDDFDSATGPAQLFAVSGLALIAGAVTLAVGINRDGVAPGWLGALFAVGVAANLAGFVVQSVPLLVVSSAVLLASMGTIAVGLLRVSTECPTEPNGQVAFGA
jgi:hypothetical protein